MKNITVYTDGGYSAARKMGAWAAIIIYPDGKEKEMSGVYSNITNNQMELMAAIESLHYLKQTEDFKQLIIQVVSDSEYLVNGANEWLQGWKQKGWKSTTGMVKNKPLWLALDALITEGNLSFSWTKGHASNRYNNRVDELAVTAYQQASKVEKPKKKARKSKNHE